MLNEEVVKKPPAIIKSIRRLDITGLSINHVITLFIILQD